MNANPENPDKVWQIESISDSNFHYASDHVICHDPRKRELYVQLFCMRPGKEAVAVSRVILNPVHAQELILNLQTQLKRLKEDLPPSR